jgi:hypothetical protein
MCALATWSAGMTPGGATEETPVAPALKPPVIRAPAMPEEPEAGKGRLILALSGNRRFCTFPDDRPIRPPRPPMARGDIEDEVITFGYQFIVAAIRRGAADTPLMLFESPVIRTASWRPASKAGVDLNRAPQFPLVAGEAPTPAQTRRVTPNTLVPYWQEQNRCTTLPEHLDFDLSPGTYDVYVAFDLLNRQGGWTHRMTAYLTDIEVDEGRRTRLDGRLHLQDRDARVLELLSATLLSGTGEASPGAGDP